MERFSLLSSSSTGVCLLPLPGLRIPKLSVCGAPPPPPLRHHTQSGRRASRRFWVFCGAPESEPRQGQHPEVDGGGLHRLRLRLPPPLSSYVAPILQSVRDLVSCRSRIARLCLRGGLEGARIDGRGVVCSGGVGTLLLSTTAAALSRARASPFLGTLAANPTFVSGLVAWALAQTTKVFLNFFVERRWDLGMLFNSGGMPSSHSALCTALTASVALCHGVGDALFPVCLGFSLIVMYDATGVRRHAGMQAAVLNMIVEDLFQGHPISQRKLKELLGHTPSQVLAGALLGVLVACMCCQGLSRERFPPR